MQHTTTIDSLKKAEEDQAKSTRENPAPIETFYSYDELKDKSDSELPEGVDGWRKEEYLNSQDFVKVVGMTTLEFQQMPQWKRDKKKRELGLF